MEEIINSSEDYEGQTLHEFRLIFHSISKKQRQWLISHFEDYAWDGGLSISQCFVSKLPKFGFFKSFSKNETDVEFKFTSIKPFKGKDWNEWTEDDLEEILDTRLVGKSQFFSNIYFSEIELSDKKIFLIDQDHKKYEVEISKESNISRI